MRSIISAAYPYSLYRESQGDCFKGTVSLPDRRTVPLSNLLSALSLCESQGDGLKGTISGSAVGEDYHRLLGENCAGGGVYIPKGGGLPP